MIKIFALCTGIAGCVDHGLSTRSGSLK